MTVRRRRRAVAALAPVLAAFAVVAWAFWSATGDGSAAAPSGSLVEAELSVPATAFNSVTVTWSEQASLDPVSADPDDITYSVERKLGAGSWAAVPSGDCSGAQPYGVTSCSDVPPGAGSYRYRAVATFHTWAATSAEAGPVAYDTDTTAPTNAITLSSITGGAFKSGATVFYRGAALGSFRLTNAVSDSGPAGPASSQTAALTGTSTGWTHSPSLVSTPSGGPYVSNLFSWTAATTSSPGETVTGRDAAANTAATALTFTDDSVAPTAGTVDATGLVGAGARYSTSTALSIAFSAGTDGGSGLATGAQLRRAFATLTNGTCGSYGAYAQVGADDPVSPVADTVAGQFCYRYQYVVSDRVGNQTIDTSPDIKVDTTAPGAPTFAFSAPTNTYGTGSNLYYRGSQTSGGFTVTASAAEPTSGMASYAYPSPPAGWSATTGALGVKSYSWSAINPTAGAQSVTGTNDATLTSAAGAFTLVSDTTAPATGSVTYANGFYGSASVSVSFSAGTDGGSGIDATSGLLQRHDATFTNGLCGTFNSYATITGGTDPTSPFVDTTVVNGRCYQYRYLVSDNVGNQATYTSANAAGIDTTQPTITRATVAKSTTSTAGTVRQGATYNVYAQVTDNQSLSTATADTSSFDTGVTATSLTTTGGPWTVGGLSYNRRSVALTANTGLTTGPGHSYTVTATDAATNVTGPTSFAATIETYDSVINATTGLISYWRFNDGVIGADEFTDTAATELSGHTGSIGESWTAVPSQARTAVISNAGRLRKETGNGAAQYYTSAAPASANYLVEADVQVVSLAATDSIGVVGRQDTSGTGQTYYMARYVRDSSRWELSKVISGTSTLIGTGGSGTGFFNQTLTAGNAYRVTLRMNGASISLQVDGVTRLTAGADSSITATGRGGVIMGTAASTAQVSDSVGLHLDDFHVSTLTTTADDAETTNNGTFTNGPVLNEPGALAGDVDRAARVDGTNDYVTVPDALSLDTGDGSITLEAWVKRNTSTAITGAMVFFDKGNSAIELAWETSTTVLVKNGVAYIGTWNTTINNTNWHHIVVTRTTTAANLYVDGANVAGGTITPQTLVNTALPLVLGAQQGTSAFLAATMDEFAIYNGALSAATVLDHYRAGMGTG